MEEYQVIIVGAGPAGSACAKALHNEGVEVLVIEKDQVPRNKICSGILFGQTQVLLKDYFGALPPQDMYCEPRVIKASAILEWSRERGFSPYVWELPKSGQVFPTDYYNIWRRDFDFWLLQQAGVAYRDSCTFNGYSTENDTIKVEVSLNNGSKQHLYCSYLVGADGVNSPVRKCIDPSYCSQNNEVVIYQTYYRFANMGKLQDAHWYVFFEPVIGDMLSCVHRKDEFLTLCVGGFKGRNLKDSMEQFKTFLADTFNVVLGDRARGEGCVLRPSILFLGKGKVIMTGEAAGIMYLNGEGISAALDSGYQAGKAVAHALQKEEDTLTLYAKQAEEIVKHVQLCAEHIHFFV
jgi:flavin-dependent dehydrogenase